MARFTGAHSSRLDDPKLEAVHSNIDQRIDELQRGALAVVGGRLLDRRSHSSSGNGQAPDGTACIVLTMIGGGGGGGGAGGGANQAVGGGGGPGEVIRKVIGTPGGPALARAYSWSCGAGGAKGASTGTNGSSGGNTTFTAAGRTITAGGGTGGTGKTSAAVPVYAAPGGAVTASEPDVEYRCLGIGTPGLSQVTNFPVGGYGGPTPFGNAGSQPQSTTADAPSDATGGGGGSGGISLGATGRAGGAGGAGLVLVEFYT